jgi:hypothetical protein
MLNDMLNVDFTTTLRSIVKSIYYTTNVVTTPPQSSDMKKYMRDKFGIYIVPHERKRVDIIVKCGHIYCSQ